MNRNRSIFTSLGACLLLVAGAQAEEAAKDKETATQVIRWTGSAYKDGDAFILTAEIFPSRVELHWDGFRGTVFAFLDDKQQETPPRVKREYIFKDEATVKAFGTLAAEAEQCNPGPLMVMGQGVSTEVVVESPPGKAVQSMIFFATPSHLLKANRFEEIPFQVREAKEGAALELPAEDPFARSIRNLAAELSRSRDCLAKLEAAYQGHGELPLAEMEALRAPVPMAQALAFRGRSTKGAESSGKLVATAEALLADCFGPVHRARFLAAGEGQGEGGVLVTLEGPIESGGAIPHECLPVKLGKAERPPTILQADLEEVLLRFIVGSVWSKDTNALKLEMTPASTYALRFSDQGGLALGLSEYVELFRSLNPKFGSIDATLEDPGLRARLEYLNSKGIVRFLLAGEVEQGKPPAWVKIEELKFHPGAQRTWARFQFRRDGIRQVAEVDQVDGRWVPMKVQGWKEYQIEEQERERKRYEPRPAGGDKKE